MSIKLTEKGGVSILTVRGGLSNSAVDEFMLMLRGLHEEGKRKILLDLSKCGGITGINISILLYFKDRMCDRGGDIRIAGAGNGVARYFKKTGVDKIFDIRETPEEAISRFAGDGEG